MQINNPFQMNDWEKEAMIKHLPDQLGDVPVTYADISKTKRLPGYNPRVSLKEGIERFVEWYRERI